MRFHIVLATLLLILVFAGVLERRFEWHQKPLLLAQAESTLASAQLSGIVVQLDHFDARLSGTCTDPDGREKARELLNQIRGIRVPEWNNHVRVPAKVVAKISDKTITLSGWLPNEALQADLINWVKQFRPELTINDRGLRTSPHVDLGKIVAIAEGRMSEVFADVLAKIRIPPFLSITRDGPRTVIRGRVQSEALAEAITKAAGGSINGRLVTIDITANKHTPDAAFAKGDATAKFIASFLNSPSPGTFSIDPLNGPQLKAYATAQMESEWLALLRPLSGSARVNTNITRVPSIYHFPDYQPISQLPPGMAESLRSIFQLHPIYFDIGSATLRPEEAIKLGPLVYLINSAGPQASFIIAASADSGGEPGVQNDAIQRARGDAVRVKLAQLGVANTHFEVQVFNAIPNPQLPPDEARRQTRRVEFLIK